jgi:hypothetical protein
LPGGACTRWTSAALSRRTPGAVVHISLRRWLCLRTKNPAAAGSVLISVLSPRRNRYSPFGLFVQHGNGNHSQLINQPRRQ